MGNRVFFLHRQLRHGAVKSVRAENRIIAEAVLAAGRRKDHPLARSLGGKYVAVRESTAERADKPRRAVVSPAEIPKQEVIAVGVGIVMISGIARGMHARRAAERVHAEAGIVRDGSKPRGAHDGFGLDAGVFRKRFAGLLDFFRKAGLGFAYKLYAEVFKKRAELPQLVLIVGCQNQFHSSSASANSSGTKGLRSFTPSPTPMNFTGRPSSRLMANTMPPLAVPSSFVRTMPVSPADSPKTFA